MSQLHKPHFQSLSGDYENLPMNENDLMLDFFGKVSCFVIKL